MNEYGSKDASPLTSQSESSGGTSPDSEQLGVPLQIGSFSIDDAIQMHLVDCVQCRDATEHAKPVGMGQRSGHCNTYWQLQLLRANYEGQVNHIVHWTEEGYEAPTGRPLE